MTEVEMKVCKRCRMCKPVTDYHQNRASRDGLARLCKLCACLQVKESYKRRRDRVLAYAKRYAEDNKEKISAYRAQYEGSDMRKAARAKHKAIPENAERLKKHAREYLKARYTTDVQVRLRKRLRARLYSAGKALRQGGWIKPHTLTLLACCTSEFQAWMEHQFLDGMSWQNIGEWHIDHVVPVAAFDLTDDHQLAMCFHWTNMQPLWQHDNLVKSDKVCKLITTSHLADLAQFSKAHTFAQLGYEVALERVRWLEEYSRYRENSPVEGSHPSPDNQQPKS